MKSEKSTNTTLLLTFSSLFEYYDFVIYGLMSGYLGILFFPSNDHLVSQLKAFAVFALSYVIRPIGGIIFAILADTSSRKKIFILSNMILAFATIGIAILPTYNQIGVTATIALIILRISQAASFAIELPGSMVLIQEKNKENAIRFSFIISGTAIGTILASFSIYLIENKFSQTEILSYAWRIPFIFGGILCLIGILMRSKLPESKNFSVNKLSVLSNILPQLRKILQSIFIIILPAFLIVMNILFPHFLSKFYAYKSQDIYLGISISVLFASFYTPCFAYIINKLSRILVLKITVASTIFLGFIINFFFLRGGFTNLLIGLCLYQAIICSVMVNVFPLMNKIFQEQTKLTMITISYNLSYSIIAFIPILVTNFSIYLNSAIGLWIFLSSLCIFILINLSNFEINSRPHSAAR